MTRRTLVPAVVLFLAVSGLAGGWLGLRSAGGATGLCARPSTGLKARSIPKSGLQEATVVLTNFRFGRMDDFYGLAPGGRWPLDGIMIAVTNEGPAATPQFRRALHVTRNDFQSQEGMRWPAAHLAIRSHGRVLEAYVELRSVTRPALATVNRALADVRVCST